MKQDYDIIIIGGGMVGTSLACALQELSLSVAIVEARAAPKQHPPTFDARAISLSLGSQRILHSIGLWPLIAPSAEAIKHIHVSERGHFGATRFHADDADVEALGYVVEAQQIGHALYQFANNIEQLDWIMPATIDTIEHLSDRVQVSVQLEQAKVTLTAKLLIAADGAKSTTRQLAHIAATVKDYQQTALVTTIGLARSHGNIAYERFSRSGPIALLPLSDQRSALIWSVTSERAEVLCQLEEHPFLAELQDQFGYRLGRFVKCGKRVAYPLQAIAADKLSGERLLLIGNAANALHPIAGQGFNLGLRDVAMLAQIIRDTCRAGGDIGSRSILQHYVEQRRVDQQNIRFLCDLLPRIFSQRFLPYSWFRDACILSLDNIPFWKRYFMRHTMGVHGRLSDLGCGMRLAE